MASEIRNFTGFKKFPGKINDDTNNYEFPILFIVSDSGKIRQWAIYVRLIKLASKKASQTKQQNWNLLLEDQVPIKKEYLEDDVIFPEGILAQVWTEGGFVGMKISRSAPTYTEIKNKGKKNERNVFHQALVVARAKYLKKIQEGSTEKRNLKPQIKKDIKDVKFFPMLAKNVKDVKKIDYPVYIQPKLDGLRCITYLGKNPSHDVTEEDVIMYSRQKKEYPSNSSTIAIKKALLQVLIDNYDEKKSESIYFDGELYSHGKSLQTLNSATRGTSKTSIEEKYHIYDMFYPSYENETFEQRTSTLAALYQKLTDEQKEIIKLVPTHLVTSQKENDKLYRDYLDKKYEGVMIRNPDGAYAKSATKKSSALRSKNLLKRKEVYDGEYEVVDFTSGKMGKDVGALIWICQTKNKETFNVVPNLSYKERYALYKDCQKNFVNKYKNKMMTVEYRSFSDSGVPSHAKAIDFRIDG